MFTKNNWAHYKNGNYMVHIDLNNGTKIRENDLDSLIPSRPESIDCKITNQCDMGCPYCHERSCSDGYHADILDMMRFVDTMPEYMEMAIGGGNPLSHPYLLEFLRKCKNKKIIASMTVHTHHFMNNLPLLRKLRDEGLIFGLGVSLSSEVDKKFIDAVKEFPNAVIHVINGCTWPSKVEQLKNHDLKLLILGFKEFGRGADTYRRSKEVYDNRFIEWQNMLPKMVNEGWFNTISFDNLAIKQLNPKQFMTDEEYEKFYMGDDGQYTFFVDLVEHTYCKSSTTPKSNRYVMGTTATVQDMFDIIREHGDHV